MLVPNTILQQRYQVIRQIGQGGMGAVYEALDQRLGHTVALKELIVSGQVLREAFEDEARRLAHLRHVALPKVSDHFSEKMRQYLVMEYIKGDDFGALIKQRATPFTFQQVQAWAEQLLNVLDYLHHQQPPIIHRDIKPSNIKLTPKNKVVLLDFGLSKGGMLGKMLDTQNLSKVYGYTPHYAPLEQIEARGTDERSDLYGLAATLYHLLTKEKPAEAIERQHALHQGHPDSLQPIRDLNPQVPSGMAGVLMKGLALNPDQRPSSAKSMLNALRGTTPPTAKMGTSGQTRTHQAPTPATFPQAHIPTTTTFSSNGVTVPMPHVQVSQRTLHFFWLTDCSGSMRGKRIASLNQAIREALPEVRKAMATHPEVQIMMRAIKFATHAEWHVGPAAVPLEQFTWPELSAGGLTATGQAIQLLASQTTIDKMPTHGYPPVIVLVSDGYCTDAQMAYERAIADLLALPWGKKAVRLAIAIGDESEYDENELLKFVSHPDSGLLKAHTPEELVNHIQWASVMASMAASIGKSKMAQGAHGKSNVNLPPTPDPIIGSNTDLF